MKGCSPGRTGAVGVLAMSETRCMTQGGMHGLRVGTAYGTASAFES
jgi:hypothetical protein